MIHQFCRSLFLAGILAVFQIGAVGHAEKTLRIEDGVNHVAMPDYKIGSSQPLQKELTLRNESDRAVQVLAVRATCSCVRVGPVPKRIKSGEKATLSVTITPELRGSQPAQGDNKKLLTIRFTDSGDEIQELRIPLVWSTFHPLKPTPTEIRIEQLRPAEKFEATLRIVPTRDRASDAVEIHEVRSDFSFLKVRTEGDQIAVSGIMPRFNRFARDPHIVVHASLAGQKMPYLKVPVTLQLASPPVICHPPQIPIFGAPGKAGKRTTVRVASLDGIPFKVLQVRLLSQDGKTLQELDYSTPGTKKKTGVLVEFTIPEMDQSSAVVEFMTSRTEYPNVHVRVINAY